jgi:hypothetical protein
MNPFLTHQMALSNQQELHRRAERSRAASGAVGHSRFATLCRRVLTTRFAHQQPQTQNPAPHAIVGVSGKA